MDWFKHIQAEKIARSIRANPKLAVGSIAAGLVAPAFVSNDDRGYFESSLITTPAIAAIYLAAPKLKPVVNTEGKQIKSYFNEAKDRFVKKGPKSYDEIKAMQDEYRSGNIRTHVFNSSIKDFYFDRPDAASRFNNRVNQLRTGLMDVPTGVNLQARTRYLESVAHAESLKYLGTKEISRYQGKLVAPKIGMDGVRDLIESQIARGNEPFVKAMNFHVQKSRGLSFANVAIPTDPFDLPGGESIVMPQSKTSKLKWREGAGRLKGQRPELHEAIMEQLRNKSLKAHEISLIAVGDDSIVGLRVRGINVSVNQAGGRIIGGKSWDKSGLARGVFVGNTKMAQDVYAIKHLGKGGPAIKQELAGINIIGGVDTLKDWQDGIKNGSAASDLKAGIISQRYVASNLTGFGENGEKGWDSLTASEMESEVEKLSNRGLIKAGSEKMGRVFEDEVLSGASLYGLQNPARQNQYLRAFTKETSIVGANPLAKPYMISDMFESMTNDSIPIVGVRQGAVGPEQRTFFANLPSRVEELHTYENEALKMLQERHGLEGRELTGAWKKLSTFLSDPKNLAVMRKSEALGEGSSLAVRNMFGMKVGRNRNFTVG